jgi:hypothetical protein
MTGPKDIRHAKIILGIILICIIIVMTAIIYIIIPTKKPVTDKAPTPVRGKRTPVFTTMTPTPTIKPKPTLGPTLRPVPTQEWHKYRKDAAMTGYSRGTSKMTKAPVLDWSYDMAGRQGYAILRLSGGYRGFLKLPERTLAPNYLETNQTIWNLGVPSYDLSGNGKQVPAAWYPTQKIAPIIKERPGLQKVVVDNYYQAGNNARARLYAYNGGNEQLIWTSEAFTNCYGPVVCIADANNDGQLDVIIAMHYRLVVLHGATGVTLMNLTYTDQRNYGFLGVASVPGDPYPKFCVISDFSQHIEVIDNNGTSLSLKWSIRLEDSIYGNTHITRPGPDSFGDMDHDGRLEVVCNVYNYRNKNHWDVLVFNADDGTIKYELNNCYLNGLVDLDNDGSVELFTTVTAGPVVPTYGELGIYQLIPSQGVTRLWTYPRGRFHTKNQESLPLTANTMAADGRSNLVYGRFQANMQSQFFISEPGSVNREICKSFRFDEQHRIRNGLTIVGPPNSKLDIMAIASDPTLNDTGALLSITTRNGSGEVLSTGATIELKQWVRQVPILAGPPVIADLEGDGRAEIIANSGAGEVFCFEWKGPEPKQGFKIRWRLKGQGMTKDAASKQDGVLIADLDQDGLKEVIIARETAAGQASIVAVSPDGTLKWQHVFPDFDGSAPVWNLGGVTYWLAGNFISRHRLDLYVSIRRNKMHSDVGFLLNGQNGRLIWKRDGIMLPDGNPAQDLRGHGGDRVAAADMDNDGLDELVCAYPDRVIIIDGPSGNPAIIKSTAYNLFPKVWAAYGVPILANLSGGPAPEILYGRSGYLTAILDNRANLLWQSEFTATGNNGCNYLQGIGDIDGDRHLEIGGIYQNATTNEYEFRVYKEIPPPRPASPSYTPQQPGNPGSSWSISRLLSLKGLGSPATDIVSADLDSDGRDEFLFGTANSLVCIGDKGLEWTLNLPAPPNELSLADINRDGKLEILVVTKDGYVRVYK